MSGTPRFIPPSSTGALVEVTYRTIQGRFLLRPSPVLNELVLGVLARAQSFCDAELIGIVVLSNHVHLLLWVENQWHLSKLMEHFGGHPDEYTTTLTVELKPLPCLEHLGWGGYVRFVTELIRDAEEEARRDRERRGVEVVGEEAIRRRDPQTRPNRVKESPAPLVHAATKEAREEWREAFGMFLLAYREAGEIAAERRQGCTFTGGLLPAGVAVCG